MIRNYRPHVVLTHKPTGEQIVVSADKSNQTNKAIALRLLRSILASGISLQGKPGIKPRRTYDLNNPYTESSRIKDTDSGAVVDGADAVGAVLGCGELDGLIKNWHKSNKFS